MEIHMLKFNKKVFKDDLIFLDGKEFLDCEFYNCQLVFSGFEMPIIKGCIIDGCDWRLSGPAQNTLIFFREIHQATTGESPAQKFIDEILRKNTTH